MNKNELLKKMEEAMDRYDLSYEVEKGRIGEWQYGVAMVPCAWVYEYVKQPEIVRCKDCNKRGQSVYRADGAEHIVCWNQGLGIQHPIDWFCADGERRTE